MATNYCYCSYCKDEVVVTNSLYTIDVDGIEMVTCEDCWNDLHNNGVSVWYKGINIDGDAVDRREEYGTSSVDELMRLIDAGEV